MNLKRLVGRPLLQALIVFALAASGLQGSVPVARAQWHSVTGLLPAFSDRLSEGGDFTPDSQTLVYLADAEMDDVAYLYAAPVAGGTPLRLNPDLESTGGVDFFRIAPDGQSVVYLSTLNSRSLTKLFSVPISGGVPTQLSGDALLHDSVAFFLLDAASGRTVYLTSDAGTGEPALYSVSIAGGTPLKISGAITPGGRIYQYWIDPIGGRALYLANAEDLARFELYAVSLTGGAVVKLSPAGASVSADAALNPTIPAVAFTAIPNGSTRRHLYHNATGGGALVELNVALGANEDVVSHRFVPDGSKVVYGVRTGPPLDAHTRGGLYAVSIGGGASTPLSVATGPSLGADLNYFDLTPDGQRVVLNFQMSDLLAPEIQSVGLDGTDRQTLYTQSGLTNVGHLEVTADGAWVLFQDMQTQDTNRLPIAGGSVVSMGITANPLVTGDGLRAISQARDPDKGPTAEFDLYSVGIADLSRRNLTRLEPDAALDEWSQAAPDGHTIAYVVVHTIGAETRREIRLTNGESAQYLVNIPMIRK